MPKRPKTPELNDGAKYLTVVNPYPPHPNMEIMQHRIEFAQWIAACTTPDYLLSFYHKPTSPGSVIIEIDESFPDFKRLLGAHKWSEFLVDPRDDGRFISKIFYCTFSSDRVVQKNGWKRIDVQDRWFRSKGAPKFVVPYPPTHWCDVPAEQNVIHNSLCRPLPSDSRPPPPPEPRVVVGTPEWQAQRERRNAPQPVPAWTRGSVAAPATTTNSKVTAAVAAANPPPASRITSSSSSSGSQRSVTAPWGRTTYPLTPPGLPVISRGPSSSGSSQRSGAGSAWGDPPSQRLVDLLDDTLSSPSSEGPPLTPLGAGPLGDAVVAGSNIEGIFAKLSVDDYEADVSYVEAGARESLTAPEGQFDILLAPRASAVAVAKSPGTVDPSAKKPSAANVEDNNDGDDSGTDNDVVPGTQGIRNTKFLCPEHNVVCRTGICAVYAKQKREQDREDIRQQREKDRAAAQRKRNKNAKKEKADESEPASPNESGTATPTDLKPPARTRELPPHLRKGAPPAPARPLPAHLAAGAPPPSPGVGRPMPARLMRGSSGPVSPASPSPSPGAGGRLAPAPPHRTTEDDLESGWGNLSEDPWVGPPSAARSPPAISSSTHNSAPTAPRPSAVWGKAPSISASSVKRNFDSWSVSARDQEEDDKADKGNKDTDKNKGKGKGKAKDKTKTKAKPAGKPAQSTPPASQREFGNWGRAPSVSGSTIQRNHDSWSVSARSVQGWGAEDARSAVASDDGNWGRPPSVVGEPGKHRMWADEMDEEDAHGANTRQQTLAVDDDMRSVVASTESGGWADGISQGPW